MNKKIAIVAALIVSTTSFAGVQKTELEVKQQIEKQFKDMSEQGRSRRHLGGWILVGAGALSLGTAPFAPDVDTESYVGAGLVLASFGALAFAVPSEQERVAKRFFEMPEATPEQMRFKSYMGEYMFAEFADKMRVRRYGGGAMLTLLGAGLVYWGAREVDNIEDTSIDTVLMVEGVVLSGLGVASFFIKTEIENEYDDFKEWKKSGQSVTAKKPSVNWGLVPNANGLNLALQMKF